MNGNQAFRAACVLRGVGRSLLIAIQFIFANVGHSDEPNKNLSSFETIKRDEQQKADVDESGSALGVNDLLVIRHGDLPIIISAPHGGKLAVPGAIPRKGDGLATGAAGFRMARDSGTEELALLVVDELDERMEGSPTCVISRVHRKFVDFNRPPDIGVEHQQARIVYDLYHQTLREAVAEVRERHGFGLLVDIHGQGSSKTTVYRGTGNGLTTRGLQERSGTRAHAGEQSLNGLLTRRGWSMHPDPFDGREQAGFTGGHIVRSYGSHQPNGIDAVQLEFGADYRTAANRRKYAEELAEAIVEYSRLYLNQPQPVTRP
ncbi:MAG: N-formylglutamate amidohydrolase [Planctomycetota bacterium]